MDISEWVTYWAGATPGRVALRFEDRAVSYADLEARVGQAARWLRANRVGTGQPVAYLGPNCPELLVLLLACARRGAVFVPLNIRMPAAELRVFLELTRPSLVVAERGLGPLATASLERRDGPASLGDGGDDRRGAGGTARRGERIRLFDAGDGGAFGAGDADGASPGANVTGAARDAAAPPVLVLFTSGTTGRPKGATFTNEHLVFNALKVITAFGMNAADEVLTAIPMWLSGGLLLHTTPALCAGAGVTIHREFDPGLILADVPRQQITLLVCVPVMTRALAAHPGWQHADLGSLRLVVTGSTVIPAAAIEAWQRKGVAVSQVYGATETCVIITGSPPGAPPEAAFTAGKPALHCKIRVTDPDGHDVSAGERGEIWIRGPSVISRYWDNPQATRAAFRHGWFRTRDIGRLDPDGYLHVAGRADDVIIVGSSNVDPSDLEAVLDDCPDITEAAVTGVPDEELGQVPAACVVLAPGRSLTCEQVTGLFHDRLAAYKHPRHVVFLDALPRTTSGKIDRARLRALTARHVAPVSPGALSPARQST
jgi:fatty-acyl-CoA synthase